MKLVKRYCNLNIGLLIAAALYTLVSSCGKDNNSSKPCRGGRYSFTVTSEFSPQREIYNVGDTIYLNSNFSKTLYDNVSLQNVDYSNSLGVGGNISTSQLDTVNNIVKYALDKFTVFDKIGTTTQLQNQSILNSGKNIFFYESPNFYEFKIGFILKEKGLYMLGINDLGSQGIAGKDCTNAGFSMTVTNTNKNLNLFQYALGYAPDALLQKSIYCFRVQ
jgi:hypothetical protein